MSEYLLWGILIGQSFSIIMLGICALRERGARRGLESDLWRAHDRVRAIQSAPIEDALRRERLLDIYAAVTAACERGASSADVLTTAAAAYEARRSDAIKK